MPELILGIETSCDDTGAAVVAQGSKLIANVVSSQIKVHSRFGGVVPEVASRKHIEYIIPVIDEALQEAGVGFNDLSGVAVTRGPGLVGALLVGVAVAKGICLSTGLPLLGVNHLAAHTCANFLENRIDHWPVVVLIVSGGHTHLFLMKGHGDFVLLGRTLDDAAGEAFDKVSRFLGFGYPGGPVIDRLAKEGDQAAVDFPRAWLRADSLDFSFSGIKTAVINYVNGERKAGHKVNMPDIAASFQEAVVDVLVEKTILAAKQAGVDTILLAGGVAANSRLRERFAERAKAEGLSVFWPSPKLCTDNAAMVATAGYYQLKTAGPSRLNISTFAHLNL